MKRFSLASVLLVSAMLLSFVGCDEGINDWNSSAKVSGYVLEATDNPVGVPGVRVIVEADVESDLPYMGPDRWFETDENGYFEGFLFLGADEQDPTEYTYVADTRVAYFSGTQFFDWVGGITLAPGSHFTLPTVYLTQFGTFSGDIDQ